MNNKKVTIRDIAKESGVSIATVSRYINKVSYTSPETEKKIQKVLDKFNYTPNAIARGLAKQKSNTIAFVTPDITNPFFPEMVRAIERAAKLKGYSLLLINVSKSDLLDEDFWNSFKSRYIDGFILAVSELSDDANKYMNALNIPYMRIDRAVDTEKENTVSVNNFEGARMAVQHLIDIGCRRIAHITGPKSLYTSVERLRGYHSVLEEHRLSPIIYEGDFTLDGGKVQTESLLKEHPDIDGVFYANDLMAIGSLKAFKQQGIHIPEDIAIIGFDGIQLAEMVNPEISTIKQPIEKIGEIATGRLIEKIESPNTSTNHNESIQLEVQLIKRESTRS